MTTYATAFIFYTLAMIGILLTGFVVYKKTFQDTKANSKGLIKILDSTPIGNKKMLLVVRVQNEDFLIASGLEHTTFLSKLNSKDSSLDNNDLKQNMSYQNDIYNQQNQMQNQYQDMNQYQMTNQINNMNRQDYQDYQNNQQSLQQTVQKLNQQAQQIQQMQQMQPRYENSENMRAVELQQQFRDLYEEDNIPVDNYNNQQNQRRRNVKQLFKTMKANSMNRGNYNG